MHSPLQLLERASRIFWALSLALAAQVNAAAQQPDTDFERIHVSLLRTAEAALSQATFEAGIDAQPAPAVDVALTAPPSGLHAGSGAYQQQQFPSAVLSILQQRGLPMGLSAVIEIESGRNPLALSRKGARGLWQLMPDTARRYGLEVDTLRDERVDIARSTEAAAQYLADLYAQFGSWPLALAAYNWGEGNLADAIARTHSSDFSLLAFSGALPQETRKYVPAVLARWGTSELSPAIQTPQSGALVYADLFPSQSNLSPQPGIFPAVSSMRFTSFNPTSKEFSK